MIAMWFEAVGTLGAFAVALIVFSGQVRDQRRAQARLVSAWLERPAMNASDGRGISDPDAVRLVVSNSSTEPVVDLLVRVKPEIPAESIYFRVFPPGRRALGASPDLINELSLATDSTLELAFTDANDKKWLRLNGSSRLVSRRRWGRYHRQVEEVIAKFREFREPLAK